MGRQANNVVVRQARPDEVPIFLDFVEKGNWDFTIYDYRASLEIDPNFLLAAVDGSGEVLGFIANEKNPNMVYVPAYIVRPDRRGKGIGKKLWNAMLERAEDRNIILDSVRAMESWYHDQGFQPSTSKVIFYHLVVSEDMKGTVPTKFDFQQLRYDTKTWQDVLAYDRQVYRGFNRERIIKAWYVGENVDSLVAYDAGKVVGYGSIHRKPNGTYGLRNVFADTEDALEAILRKLFEPVKVGSYVRFMLLDGKPLPSYLKHSTTANYFARRMFTKKMIEMDKDKIWLATSHAV